MEVNTQAAIAILEKIQKLHSIDGLVKAEIALGKYFEREARDIVDLNNPICKEITEFVSNHFTEILTGLLEAQQIAVPLFVKNANSVKIAAILIGIEEEIVAGIQAANASKADTTKKVKES